ncbi:glycosyltransferase [Jiella avicenniae]|uniref:Glycosyltransferase n=1 Tax=Jiella avicenniae TaxID=2907202 RepID=A0A9X1P7Y3_9HYPH|nr:glycosyltransferase [Jiella avicenniae]MCE7030846.1 glycosyltransferase [Jiella avicenniae]
MKILRIISCVDPEWGGPVEALRVSAGALREMGHETEIVSLDDPGAGYVGGFPFHVHPLGHWTRRYGYTPRMSQWVSTNASRFDVAIIEGLWNHASIGGWQGLRASGLPYVVFTHGMMDPWFRRAYPLKHHLKQMFWTIWQGKVLRDAATVLFTCEEERLLAKGMFRGHDYSEAVVAFGTSEPPARSQAQYNAFRALLPALDTRPYLLFLSRIHEKKGCDLLVSAFATVASSQPGIDLVIAGPDQVGLKSRLEEQARQAGIGERIHFPGMVSGDAKWGAFRGAEAFILPSHQENFGIVVAEAMACGTPVLITEKVNIWREVAASGGGLVESDTLDGVTKLLQRWLSLPEAECSEMRLRARKGYEMSFHIDAAARDLAAVLERVATRSAS